MILGIGMDLVEVERFRRHAEQTPEMLDRLFRPAEREGSWPALARRFAVKEAVAKALGAPPGADWLDCEVGPGEAPTIALTGGGAAGAARLGIARWHTQTSHGAGCIVAIALAEGVSVTGRVLDDGRSRR